jgi:hypothetical protein
MPYVSFPVISNKMDVQTCEVGGPVNEIV